MVFGCVAKSEYDLVEVERVCFSHNQRRIASIISTARSPARAIAQKNTLSPKCLLYLNCSRDTGDKSYSYDHDFCLRNLCLNLCQVTELPNYWEAEFLLLSQASVLSVGSSFIATHEPLIGVFVAVNTVGVLFMKRLKALLYVTISDEIRGFHESPNGVHVSFTSCERLTP